jgi:hypothetical protein
MIDELTQRNRYDLMSPVVNAMRQMTEAWLGCTDWRQVSTEHRINVLVTGICR